MKILQICNKPPYPPIDGGCKAMCQVSDVLIKNNIEIQVLAIETFKHPIKKDDIDFEEYKRKTNFDSRFVDIKVKAFDAFINLFTKESYNISRFLNDEFAELIKERLQNQKFDIVQLESLYAAPYFPIIKKYSNAKVVYRAHNLEHKIWKSNYKLASSFIKRKYISLLSKRLKMYEANFVKQVDYIVSISSDDSKWLNKKSKHKTSVIPFGLNPSENNAVNNNEICFLGALDWSPNINGLKWFLDRVWPLVLNKFPDTKINIAGRGASDKVLNWNYPGVKILGSIDSANEFLSKHNIMVVPLFNGSGVRIKIIEALAHQQAIVTTTIGASGLDLDNENELLIADTEKEFADCICVLMSNPQYRIQIAQNGFKRFSELYSLNRVEEQWLEFYQSIIHNNGK